MEVTEVKMVYRKYPAYKDSGLNWLSEIPFNWEIKPGLAFLYENKEKNTGMKRNTILSLSYGKIRVKAKEELTGLVPESFETYQLVNKGDIIFRPTDLQNDKVSLRSGMSEDEGIITSAYLNLRLKDSADNKFFHYIFRAIDNNKVIYGLGSGLRQNISFLDFRRFLFPFPPLPEQTAIAAFLDYKTAKIDLVIAQKEKMIALLKERKQILIQDAVTKGLNKNVKMKDSGVEWIGEIPEHWEVKKIKHVTKKIGSGITPSGGGATYLKEGGIPLLRSQNVHFGRLDLSDVARISGKVHESMKNSQVKNGDVLLNITGGSIGRCHYVEISEPLNVNQHVCIVRPNTVETKYLNFLLASEIGQGQIWFFQQGGGREGLNFQALKNFFIPYPEIVEQNEIVYYIETQSAKIDKAISLQEQQIEKLKEYKNVLIYSAVTGKIKVC